MKVQQDKEIQDIDLVKTKVELANVKYQLSVGLTDGTYISMLAYKSVDEIVKLINTDAEAIQEREKIYKESIKVEPVTPITIQETMISGPIQNAPIYTPTVPQEQKVHTEIYTISGTDAQFEALESFLNNHSYEWDYK